MHINSCDSCGWLVHYDKNCQLASDPPQYKGKCINCGTPKYSLCSDIDSAHMNAYTVSALQNIKVQDTRSIVRCFLNETPALHLERELVDLLMKIDGDYEAKLKALKLQLSIAISGGR